MMTKKDFEAIAAAVRCMCLSDGHQRSEVTLSLAEVCRQSNPRFDMDAFLRACRNDNDLYVLPGKNGLMGSRDEFHAALREQA